MKRRIVSLFLCCALLACIALTGCSKKEPAPVQTESTVPVETTVAALPTEELHSADWYDVDTLANTFAAAYFSGSKEILKGFLADTFQGEVEVYYDHYDPNEVAPNVISIKGLDSIGEQAVGDVCHPSIEFFSGIEGDSYSYLSITMVKQENGWKVQSYGLEK